MQVKPISVTVALIDAHGNPAPAGLSAEELIVYTARVSNPTNQANTETGERLIHYLLKKAHWSPFEMADFTVEIKTSRAIAQQILRHRSFSFQEFSQRYSVATEFEPVQLRKQAEKNRQSSTERFDPELDVENGCPIEGKASDLVQAHIEYSEALYTSLIAAGVAKESARMILPLTTQTTIYMKGSIRSWIHYLLIRTQAGTQLEHREIAEVIEDYFKQYFPTIYAGYQLFVKEQA